MEDIYKLLKKAAIQCIINFDPESDFMVLCRELTDYSTNKIGIPKSKKEENRVGVYINRNDHTIDVIAGNAHILRVKLRLGVKSLKKSAVEVYFILTNLAKLINIAGDVVDTDPTHIILGKSKVQIYKGFLCNENETEFNRLLEMLKLLIKTGNHSLSRNLNMSNFTIKLNNQVYLVDSNSANNIFNLTARRPATEEQAKLVRSKASLFNTSTAN